MSKKYWDKKLKDYAKEDWALKPSIFAEFAIDYFRKNGDLLELAAGYGQDGRYFAKLGYTVTQTDFSETGVKFLNENKFGSIEVKQVDLSKKLDFENEDFDIVYCHLGIHYLSLEQTKQIVSELYRILRPTGIIALFTNSTEDPEIVEGEKLENDYYRFGDIDKRYFSIESMSDLMKDFETLLLDNKGTTYKDTRFGVFNLIRYIGRKM